MNKIVNELKKVGVFFIATADEAGDGRLATFRLTEIDAKKFSFTAPPVKIEE